METTERAARFLVEIGREDLAALLRQSTYEFLSEEIWDDINVPAIVLSSPTLYSDALEGLPEWDQSALPKRFTIHIRVSGQAAPPQIAFALGGLSRKLKTLCIQSSAFNGT